MATPKLQHSPLLTSTAAAAVVLVATMATIKRHLNNNKLRTERIQRTKGGRVVPILSEEHVYMGMGPHGHITIFEGTCPEQYLRSRVEEIVKSNMWLLGRLVSDPETGKAALWIPETPDSLLRVVRVDTKEKVVSCRDQEYYATTGNVALDRMDVPLFKMTLFICEEDEDMGGAGPMGSFSILCSMNHVLGDGSTLYQIWNMIQPKAPIQKMIYDRVADWKGGAGTLTSLGDFAKKKLWWFLLWSDAGPLQQLLRGRRGTEVPTMHFTARHVRPEWIKREKEAFRGNEMGGGTATGENGKEVEYLSSNDVIVSWFFRTTKPAAGGIVVSMRDRNPHLTSLHVWNYTEPLVLYPDEYANPINLRRAVNSLGASFTGDDALKAGSGRRLGISTAWHSEYKQDLDLPGKCRQSLHTLALGLSGQRYFARWVPYIVIFQTSMDRLGIVCNTAEPLSDMEPLGDEIEGWDGMTGSFDTTSFD